MQTNQQQRDSKLTSVSTKSFKPRKLKLVASKKKLTNASGLGSMIESFDDSSLASVFSKCLPERKSNRSMGSYRLGLTQLASFLYGHDCIDDLIEFKTDPLLAAIMRGETVLPRTMSNFFRDFSVQNINALNNFLALQSKMNREHLEKLYPKLLGNNPIHLSIDSTPHEQCGKKMEGLAWNYKDMWCLDSQSVFDEMGHCYGMQLRSGNTKSGVHAGELIRSALKYHKYSTSKYLSADSAYCNQEFIKTCLSLNVKFTIAANQATTLWRDHIDEIISWEPWIYTEKEIEKAKLQKKKLPKIELGRFHWRPGWNDVLRFPVVVQRERLEQASLIDGEYKYYGIVTNHNLVDWSPQQVVEHYHKRGNVENFIREEKNAYDLKHFPCQNLRANHAFGLLAMVAQNHLRWMALIDRPTKTYFAKKFRRNFICIPGHLVKHARSLVLKIPKHVLKEVQRLEEGWRSHPAINPAITAGFPSG